MGNGAGKARGPDSPAGPGSSPVGAVPSSLAAAAVTPSGVGTAGPAGRNSNPHIQPPQLVVESPAAGSDGGNSVRLASSGSGGSRKRRNVREKNRFGSVVVKVASLSSTRRAQERQNIFTILGRGGLFYGTQCNPILVQDGEWMGVEMRGVLPAVLPHCCMLHYRIAVFLCTCVYVCVCFCACMGL
jgi:hypothetical protein